MTTLAVTLVAGAVLNATAFIGGSYLSKHFGGDSEDEKKRHDLALENYAEDYNEYKKGLMRKNDFIEDMKAKSEQSGEKFDETNESLRLFEENLPKEPIFSNYYTKSSSQRSGEILFTTIAFTTIGAIASRFL